MARQDRGAELHLHEDDRVPLSQGVYTLSLPPRAVKWKGPALKQARLCECAGVWVYVCRGSNLECAGGYDLFDMIDFPLQTAKPGGSQSTLSHITFSVSSKIWGLCASAVLTWAYLSSNCNYNYLHTCLHINIVPKTLQLIFTAWISLHQKKKKKTVLRKYAYICFIMK